MSNWLRRLRGVLGLGVVGGLTGALFGSAWAFVAPLLDLPGRMMGGVLGSAAVWGFFGAFAASGSALLLAAFARQRSLEDLSPWRVGALGVLVGSLAPSALLLFLTGDPWAPGTGEIAAISGLVGGALGNGLVAIAKRPPAGELSPGPLRTRRL